VARSFTLSAALPLNDDQRRLLQENVAVQHLVGTAEEIRNDALALLAEGHVARQLAAVSLDIALADEVERAAFVSAVVQAIRHASTAFRGAVGGERQMYRAHVAVYPRLPGA
jgi:hypothetical protein